VVRHHAPGGRLDLVNPQGAPVVHEERQAPYLANRVGESILLPLGQLDASAQIGRIDFGHAKKRAFKQLLLGHFQGEHAYWHPFGGQIVQNVGHEGSLPHGRPGSDDHHSRVL